MSKHRRNPGQAYVEERVLRARWMHWGNRDWMLEVYVVYKWRTAGYIHARKPRKLTKGDVKKVAKSVSINTDGEIVVVGLELEE